MGIWSDPALGLEHQPKLVQSDLQTIIDGVETLATLLGDLANLPNPMPGSLIAAQRLAQAIAEDGDRLLGVMRRHCPSIITHAPELHS